jgi:hypothetical protein
MLQPKRYPELMGKALVLDADPFVALADDDNPWMEGLFMVVCVGVALGIAHLLGGLLRTASLPPADAVRETIFQGWRGLLAAGTAPDADLAALEEVFLRAWDRSQAIVGLRGGPARVFFALFGPLALLIQWLFFGVVSHIAARFLGGQGRLAQTLGATALVAAPYALGLLTVVPFVTVSRLLLAAWAVLIAYRALEIVHDLPWQRAMVAALAAPLALVALAALGIITGFALLAGLSGVMP